MDAIFAHKQVLITGGLGFIGSNLAHKLVSLGARVTIIDALIEDCGGALFQVHEIQDRLKVIVARIEDQAQCSEAIIGAEIIFNLAGATSHLDSMNHPIQDLELNAAAQLRFLEMVRKLNPRAVVIYGSTRQVYGRPQRLPVDESHPTAPVDINGIHKICGEQYHQLFGQVYGLRTVILRLTNVYGPRMRVKDAKQTFLGIWIKSVLSSESFEVWGGDQLRDFCYIDDCVDALMVVATCPAALGRILNVGGDEVCTLRELAAQLVALSGSGSFEVRAFPRERKQIDIGDYYADSRAMRTLTDWAPRVPLNVGLTRTLDYFRKWLPQYLQ